MVRRTTMAKWLYLCQGIDCEWKELCGWRLKRDVLDVCVLRQRNVESPMDVMMSTGYS